MVSTADKTSVSIVIPVYYAERTIKPLVDELVAELADRYELEVILVNDGSKDGSEEACLELHHKYPAIVSYFSLSRNMGEHNAVMAGLNQVSHDYVVIMDDDFQNPVSEVAKLISYGVAHREEYDVVYTYYAEKKHSVFRNLGSWFNDMAANVMLGKPRDLYLSSFKLLRRELVEWIISYDLPYPYIDGLVLRATDRIGKVMVRHEQRREGKSGYTLRKLISLWLNTFTSFSILPLRFATLLGFIFAGIGFVLGVSIVWEKMHNPNLPVGYALMFVFTAIVSGVMLFSVGILGEYVGRVYISLSKRPQFIIRKAAKAKRTLEQQVR